VNTFSKTILTLFTAIIVAANAHATGTDTVHVFFATGVSKLDDKQQASLDSVIYRNSFKPNSIIRIIGYADEPGSVELNQGIAQRRAQAVMSYFIDFGFKKQSIVQCIGRGNLFKTGNDPQQRRVDVVFGEAPSPKLADSLERAPTEEITGIERLPTMKPNEVLVLEGLQFALSTSAFLPESYPILKKLVEVLKAHPAIKIKIEGHICCGPDPKTGLHYFYELSVERAQNVRDYLVAHQISADRLSSEGFGFSRPRVFPERNDRDRFRNRRVELRIVSN
jgi:outer membrane protein OmpA-like peptidoglycan-associated protein